MRSINQSRIVISQRDASRILHKSTDLRRRVGGNIISTINRGTGYIGRDSGRQVIRVKMAVGICNSAGVVHQPIRSICICPAVLQLNRNWRSIESITDIIAVGVGVEKVNVPRRAAGMNVKSNGHGRVRHLAVGHHIGQPDVIARALHLHSVAFVPVQLDVLNLDIAHAVDVDERLPT